jgi:hypothetical protein
VVVIKTDAHRMESLSRRLRSVAEGRIVRKEMRKKIGHVGNDMAAKMRAAVRGAVVESSNGGGTKTTKLRGRVARAIDVRVLASGVTVQVNPRRFVPTGHSTNERLRMPKYLSGEIGNYKRWRHPLFGDRKHWYQQTALTPWFYGTFNAEKNQARSKISDILSDIERKLDG